MDNAQNSQAVRAQVSGERCTRSKGLTYWGRNFQPNEASEETQKQKQLEQEIAKNSILTQVMDQSALARLNNIAAAKPVSAELIETVIQ